MIDMAQNKICPTTFRVLFPRRKNMEIQLVVRDMTHAVGLPDTEHPHCAFTSCHRAHKTWGVPSGDVKTYLRVTEPQHLQFTCCTLSCHFSFSLPRMGTAYWPE